MAWRTAVAIGVVAVLAACGRSDPGSALEPKFQSRAFDLAVQVKAAADEANDNPSLAVADLSELCQEATAFTNSFFGPAGFRVRGDIKDPTYPVGWSAPNAACLLHDALKENAVVDFARDYAALGEGLACLRSGDPRHDDTCQT
jgi:hypothetical protein